MLPLGTPTPKFNLRDTTGTVVNIDDFRDARALLIAFICNHCPYVKHIADHFSALAREYQEKGAAVIAINANSPESHPADSPEAMAAERERRGYTFPYLFDEDQEVAKAFQAACTPEFYIFNAARHLVYRGQMDDSRPGNDVPVTGADLRAALDAVLAGNLPSPDNQKPSVGCNIKWKPGNEPGY